MPLPLLAIPIGIAIAAATGSGGVTLGALGAGILATLTTAVTAAGAGLFIYDYHAVNHRNTLNKEKEARDKLEKGKQETDLDNSQLKAELKESKDLAFSLENQLETQVKTQSTQINNRIIETNERQDSIEESISTLNQSSIAKWSQHTPALRQHRHRLVAGGAVIALYLQWIE